MTPDDIARRYAHRPGCRFVAHEPVGIAVFAMNVRIIAMAKKPLPPIDEFLLRGIGLEIGEVEGLSGLYGLDRRTVNRRLVELRRSEMIDLRPNSGEADAHCQLTTKGRQAAEAVERSELMEMSVPIVFHGFQRCPLLVREQELLRPAELRDNGWREIPAIPGRYPNPEEVDLHVLEDVVTKQWRFGHKGDAPQLIAVRTISKGVKTMFLPAVMLVYELLGSPGKKHIGFAVGGVQDEKCEAAFAACRGPERLVDLAVEEYKGTKRLAAEYLRPELVPELGQLEQVDALKEQLDAAKGELAETKNLLDRASQPDTRQELRRQLDDKEAKLKQLEQQLSQHKAVRLNTYDCADILRESLEKASNRLVIVSAFVSSSVIDRLFLERLESALKRGVKVWIAYGLGAQVGRDADRTRQRDWTDAESALNNLRTRYRSQFKLSNLGDTHEKILLRDNEFVVTGSFNWLSFRGDRRRKLRREDALLVTYPPTIEEYFMELTSRFAEGKGSN